MYRTYEELKLLAKASGRIFTAWSLYRTYEELKHRPLDPIAVRFPCLYRTYEELKRPYRSHLLHEQGRLYRTYEELKLGHEGANDSAGKEVCIVPMRN